MTESLTLAAITGSGILVWVLYLYRKGRLKEDHALLWMTVSIAIILLSTWTDLLLRINQAVGATRVSDVVLAAFIAFLLIVGIYHSIGITNLTEQNRKTAQELAVLKTLSGRNIEFSRQQEGERED